jgi:hypothetical protein
MSAKKQDVAHIEQFPIEQHNTNLDSLAAAASTPEFISPVKQAPEGDTALALFQGTEQLYEAIDPGEERKLVKKIDMVILPCLAVCYVFYYVSDLNLTSCKNIRWWC